VGDTGRWRKEASPAVGGKETLANRKLCSQMCHSQESVGKKSRMSGKESHSTKGGRIHHSERAEEKAGINRRANKKRESRTIPKRMGLERRVHSGRRNKKGGEGVLKNCRTDQEPSRRKASDGDAGARGAQKPRRVMGGGRKKLWLSGQRGREVKVKKGGRRAIPDEMPAETAPRRKDDRHGSKTARDNLILKGGMWGRRMKGNQNEGPRRNGNLLQKKGIDQLYFGKNPTCRAKS